MHVCIKKKSLKLYPFISLSFITLEIFAFQVMKKSPKEKWPILKKFSMQDKKEGGLKKIFHQYSL